MCVDKILLCMFTLKHVKKTLRKCDETPGKLGFTQGIYKGESGLFLTPVLTLWGGSHFDCHIWRWVIIGRICTHYRFCVLLGNTLNTLHDLSPQEKGNTLLRKLLGGLRDKQIWRYNNSPLYVAARWPS